MKKILIALLCTLCIKVSAQTINTRLDSLFDYCHKNFLFNGTVLISENGKIVFSKAYGEADVQNKAPNTMSTKFQLGAISKQFTAFIILKLVDEGKIRNLNRSEAVGPINLDALVIILC